MRREHAPNRVNLKLGDISTRMAQDVPPVLTDLLELAVYVYCADQFTSRAATRCRIWAGNGVGLPLPGAGAMSDLWSRSDVQDLLIETLGFLSDDDYAFEFVPHPDPAPSGLQHHLDFAGSADRGFVPDDVILFSGGLDFLRRRRREPDRPWPQGGPGQSPGLADDHVEAVASRRSAA